MFSLFVDIDECVVNAQLNDTQCGGARQCEQMCTNTIGSYNCSCSSEYSLADDLHNCLGMCHCVRHTLHCVDHHIKPFCL